MLLSAFNELQGKGVPYIPMHLRTRQNITLDPAVQQHLEAVEFQLKEVFLIIFILKMDRKPKVVEFFILGPSMASTGTLKGGKTKKGGISDNNDNATIFKLYWYDGDLCGKSERQGLSHCQIHLNPASIRSLAHFSDFVFVLSRSYASRQWQLPWTRREGCKENTSQYAHTRTFLRCASSHARCDHTFGSRAWRFVCVPKKPFHPWSCLCWMFLRPRFLLFSLHWLPHWRHLLPLLRCPLESDQTRVQLRSGMDCLAVWRVRSQT